MLEGLHNFVMYRLFAVALIILSSVFLASLSGDSFFPGKEINTNYWKIESHTETVSPNKGRQSQRCHKNLVYQFFIKDELTAVEGNSVENASVSARTNN